MFFRFDEKDLLYKEICLKKSSAILVGGIALFTMIGYFSGKSSAKEKIVQELIEGESAILINEVDTFSQAALIDMLKDLNVRYPHIVMAQSIVETGHWSSRIFLENHNLFGMKEARRRITTAGGTSRNHAYYAHWRESVYDYAFYQCRYLSKLNNEDEYFQYLDASYAEADGYVASLKQVIEKENLRALFD